jgi:transposase
MGAPLRLTLTGLEVLELEEARDADPRPYVRERSAALLKIADSQSGRQVALHGLLRQRQPDTVYDWVKRYKADGFEGLLIKPGRGRNPAFATQHHTAEEAQAAVLHIVRRDPHEFGEAHSRWTLQGVQRVCEWLRPLTPQGVWQMLERLHIHYKRGRDYVHSPDGDYLAKLQHIQVHIQSATHAQGLMAVLFEDELTYYRQPTVAPSYELAGHIQPLARRSYRCNTKHRVVGTLDALTGQVLYQQGAKIGVPELVRFYERISEVYRGVGTIALVQDNWPIHFHPDVLAALEPQQCPFPFPRPKNWPTEPSAKARRLNLPIQLLPLPTYASWTNPIEKLWRWLKQDVLHLHPLADDWKGLQNLVSHFLDQFADGSTALLHYVGLQDLTKLYHSALDALGKAATVT